MKPFGIALLGFGTVGSAVYEITKLQSIRLTGQTERTLEIRHILVQDPNKTRLANVPAHLFKTDFDEILADKELDAVVEVMGGVEPAKNYLKRAILAKKHIVTANKELLAKHGQELVKLARKENVKFQFEASVAGGIPIIKALQESLGANQITKIIGIINGTSNYILTKMVQEGISLEEALKEAQLKGYAEADPTNDLDGFDVAYKLFILSSLAFGSDLDLNKINIEGIRNIEPVDLEYGSQLGYTLKLLAIGKETEQGIDVRVQPTFIPENHPLASVSDVFNAVYLEGDSVGELMFYGRGAGGLPTASAVCSDIIDLVLANKIRGYASPAKIKEQLEITATINRYYIRISVQDIPGVLGKITTAFGQNKVSIHSVIQKGEGEEPVLLVFVTHEVRESNLRLAIDDIKALDCVFQVDNIIRIEEDV